MNGIVFFGEPAGVKFDAVSNSGYQTLQSTYSWNHTCTGSDRFLSVDIAILSIPGTTVASVTYNGVFLSFIGAKSTVSGAGRVECWSLVAPASGTNTITVTLSTAVASAGIAVSYTGVHQSSPTEGFNSSQATNVGATDATVAITSVANNDWIHAAIATDDTSITANQTTRNNVTGTLGSGANEDNLIVNPPSSITMGYTNVAALATWTIAGYALRPVSAVAIAVAYPFFRLRQPSIEPDLQWQYWISLAKPAIQQPIVVSASPNKAREPVIQFADLDWPVFIRTLFPKPQSDVPFKARMVGYLESLLDSAWPDQGRILFQKPQSDVPFKAKPSGYPEFPTDFGWLNQGRVLFAKPQSDIPLKAREVGRLESLLDQPWPDQKRTLTLALEILLRPKVPSFAEVPEITWTEIVKPKFFAYEFVTKVRTDANFEIATPAFDLQRRVLPRPTDAPFTKRSVFETQIELAFQDIAKPLIPRPTDPPFFRRPSVAEIQAETIWQLSLIHGNTVSLLPEFRFKRNDPLQVEITEPWSQTAARLAQVFQDVVRFPRRPATVDWAKVEDWPDFRQLRQFPITVQPAPPALLIAWAGLTNIKIAPSGLTNTALTLSGVTNTLIEWLGPGSKVGGLA